MTDLRGADYQPVSLGHTCETKFQIARRLNQMGRPGQSEMRFRLSMAPPERGARYFGWDMFDWLGISLESVCAYLERDFQGVFEQADLDLHGGGLWSRSLGVNHIHDFEGFGALDASGAVTPALVERLYPARRAAFERRAAAFRERLRQPGPFLYVHQCNAIPEDAAIRRLIAALGRHAEHRFHLLLVAPPASHRDLSAFAEVSQADAAAEHGKPTGREWEGADEAWDAALRPFSLTTGMAAKAADGPPPEKAGGPLARLFGR